VTSCIVDSAAIYIMVVKFRNTICPPPPQISLHRRAALSSNSNGTRSVYNRKNPKSSLYCEMSMMQTLITSAHVQFAAIHFRALVHSVKFPDDEHRYSNYFKSPVVSIRDFKKKVIYYYFYSFYRQNGERLIFFPITFWLEPSDLYFFFFHRTLLEYGAAVGAESKAGFTPLHLAAQVGSFFLFFCFDKKPTQNLWTNALFWGRVVKNVCFLLNEYPVP
jgi:hypothetical protein